MLRESLVHLLRGRGAGNEWRWLNLLLWDRVFVRAVMLPLVGVGGWLPVYLRRPLLHSIG